MFMQIVGTPVLSREPLPVVQKSGESCNCIHVPAMHMLCRALMQDACKLELEFLMHMVRLQYFITGVQRSIYASLAVWLHAPIARLGLGGTLAGQDEQSSQAFNLEN